MTKTPWIVIREYHESETDTLFFNSKEAAIHDYEQQCKLDTISKVSLAMLVRSFDGIDQGRTI